MRGYVINDFGGPDQFTPTDLPMPSPGPGQVLVRVAATSVNPVDYKIRSGAAAALSPELPARLHGDVSGIVQAVGEHVVDFKPGDAVYGCVGGVKGTQGVLAEYALAEARLLAPAPKSIPLADAAALPLIALTAWEGLDKANIQPQQRVLVHGGTGGVGHLALQLAKARGCEVTTTVGSASKLAITHQLGADHTINYREETAENYVARLTGGVGFDCVFDTVGGDNIATSITAARLNGHVVCIQGRSAVDGGALHAKAISLHLVFMLIPLLHGIDLDRHGRILREVAALVDAGKTKPLIDAKRFSFEQIGQAHDFAESGQQVGKVLVVREQVEERGPLMAREALEVPGGLAAH